MLAGLEIPPQYMTCLDWGSAGAAGASWVSTSAMSFEGIVLSAKYEVPLPWCLKMKLLEVNIRDGGAINLI